MQVNKIKPLLFLLFLLPLSGALFFNTAAAQLSANQYSLSFLTTREGLSQASNIYMLQDKAGYMWMSTHDGVNRYNGKDFFYFSDTSFYKKCRPLKSIYGMVEDAGGNIWMGSMNGLYCYKRRQNLFEATVVFKVTAGNGIITMPFALVKDEVWVYDGNLSFKAINVHTQKQRDIFAAQAPVSFNQFANSLPQVDHEENIWLVKNNTIFKITGNAKKLYRFSLFPGDNNKNLVYETVTHYSLHKQLHWLAVSTTKGFVLFNTITMQPVKIKDRAGVLSDNEISYTYAGHDAIWISTPKHPLVKIGLQDTTTVEVLEKKVFDNDVHRGSTVTSMYEDKWNRLWLNANGEYLAVIDFRSPFIKKVIAAKENGLPAGTCNSIAVADSMVWVSDSWLSKIDKATAAVLAVYSSKILPGNVSNVSQLFFDSIQQRLWVSAAGKIFYYDIRKKQFIKISFEITSNGITDKVRCFVKLSSGQLLIVYTDAIYAIDSDGKTGRRIPELTADRINHLVALSANRVALCATGQPLKIYSYTKNLQFSLLKSVSFEGNSMMSVEDDSDGSIWVASDHGVYRIAKDYSISTHFSTQSGMANDFVYAVIPDKYGWVWCSTNRGIIAINKTNSETVNYGLADNLQEMEFNNRCFASDREGYIYFGGVNGINYFKPPFTDNDTIQPKLLIEDISLNDKVYNRTINPDDIDEVIFNYNAVSLSLKIQALHLVKATALKIIYRIKGQHDWIQINNGEYIRMFNLAPGKYTLEVSYRNGTKHLHATVRQLTITVLPPFYRTSWFLLFTTLISFLLIYLLVHRWQKTRIEKLKQENEIFKLKTEQQLAVIKERERIITDLHDDIGATLSSMNIYGDLAGNIWETQPMESKKMIEKISGTSKDLMGRMGDIIWSMKPADEEKYTLEARLKNYSNELLTPKNIITGFEIDEKLAAAITNPEIRKNILLIAKEAINNIAKYSEATKAIVSLKQKDELVLLNITDNGNGYEKENVKPGNGLSNIQHRAVQLNGVCNIVAAVGKGVSIECIFPMAIIRH